MLDLAKPMQTECGTDVRFIGEIKNTTISLKYNYMFEYVIQNSKSWHVGYFSKEGNHYDKECRSASEIENYPYDIINTPESKLEIKVDCYYWTSAKEIVKIFYRECGESLFTLHGIFLHNGAYARWKKDGNYYADNSSSCDNLIKELTHEEYHIHVVPNLHFKDLKKENVECDLFTIPKPKTTGLIREEMLKAIDEGKTVKTEDSGSRYFSSLDSILLKVVVKNLIEKVNEKNSLAAEIATGLVGHIKRLEERIEALEKVKDENEKTTI